MTPLYPDGVYAPLPRFSKKTQTNIAPSATRNTASARCSRDAPIISVAWSSKGSLLFPCFGEPSPRYSPRHMHSGSSHRFYALRRRSDIPLLDALRDSCDILLEQMERRGEEHEVLKRQPCPSWPETSELRVSTAGCSGTTRDEPGGGGTNILESRRADAREGRVSQRVWRICPACLRRTRPRSMCAGP